MAHEYASGFSLADLMVPTKAATIFAAQESSLYMGGALVPMLNCPAGSTQVKVPKLAKIADPLVVSSEADSTSGIGDISVTAMSDSSVPINLGLYASRSVVRDLGGVDTNEIGRVLGNSIASVWDKAVTASFVGLTAQELTGAAGQGLLTVEALFEAVGTIRGEGETGSLFGIIGTNQYANLMKDIGGTAFAGGEFQNTAMRNGYFGTIAGVPLFVSSYINNTDMGITTNPAAAIMSMDAVKGATQGGVNLEISRRPEAVGFDVVASLAAGVAVTDAARGVLIIDNAA